MVRGALKLFYNDHFSVPLPPNHRFPMPKYALVRKALQRELTPRGLASFHPSPLASLDELTACHTAEYVDRYVNNKLSDQENRRVGFPWSQASVDRSLSSTGGTVAAMREVCTTPAVLAGHLAGGTHHAFADRGEGLLRLQRHRRGGARGAARLPGSYTAHLGGRPRRAPGQRVRSALPGRAVRHNLLAALRGQLLLR